MIRSLTLIVAALFIANLVAAASFVTWLGISNRISLDRLFAVKEIFVETVPQQEMREKGLEREAEAQAQRDIEAARPGTLPVTAEQRLRIIQEYEEVSTQRNLQIQRETQNLLALQEQRREQLEKDLAEFTEDVNAWKKEREALIALQTDVQFAKTVAMYDSVKSDVAKSMLSALIDKGEIDQVVAYLDAMNPRKSNKVVSAFEKDSPALAADLLERLRLLGIEFQDEETLADAQP